MTDMRFIRLASVGLMVRAPRPVAIDILLEPPGVAVLPGVPLRFPGVVWPTVEVETVFCESGVREGVNKSLEETLLGTRTDLAFAALGELEPSLSTWACGLPCLRDKLLSALDFLPPILGRLLTSISPSSGGRNVPGPTDFLGAVAGGVPLLLKALGGKWLCRRPLNAELVLGVTVASGSAFDTYTRLAVDADESLRESEPPPAADTFRVGAGIVVWAETFLCSNCGSEDASGACTDRSPPGRGKWLKFGSLVVILSWKSSKLKVGSWKLGCCVLSNSCRPRGTVFVGSIAAKLKSSTSFSVGSRNSALPEVEFGRSPNEL